MVDLDRCGGRSGSRIGSISLRIDEARLDVTIRGQKTQHQYTKKNPSGKIDTPREGEESIFDAFVYLRRSLNKFDSKLLRKLAALFLCYSPLIRPVRFVANKNLIHTLRSVLLNVSVPRADVYVKVGLTQSLHNTMDTNVLLNERSSVTSYTSKIPIAPR